LTWTAAITDFKSYLLLERSFSEHSIEAYIRDVNKLREYIALKEYQILPLQVTPKLLSEMIIYLNGLGLEMSSQARLLSGIKAFYKYLLVEDLLDTDPTELLASPRINRKIPDVLSYPEIEQILAAIDLSTPHGLRNRAIVETLYACGLRVSELTALRLTNIFFDIGFIRVVGKGNKERIIPIGDDAIKHVRIYIQNVRNHMDIPKTSENILFLNRRGAGLSRIMIFMIIKELVEAAGIQKTVSPHTFRHSFATHLIEGGADLKIVQDLLGHESITTTEIYTHMDTDYLRETINTFHPRNQRKS